MPLNKQSTQRQHGNLTYMYLVPFVYILRYRTPKCTVHLKSFALRESETMIHSPNFFLIAFLYKSILYTLIYSAVWCIWSTKFDFICQCMSFTIRKIFLNITKLHGQYFISYLYPEASRHKETNLPALNLCSIFVCFYRYWDRKITKEEQDWMWKETITGEPSYIDVNEYRFVKLFKTQRE